MQLMSPGFVSTLRFPSTSNTLRKTSERNRLEIRRWTYWGLPLVPTLMVRKLWLAGQHDQSKIITTGFDARAAWVNRTLGALAGCEWIPQKLLGTSLLAILTAKE